MRVFVIIISMAFLPLFAQNISYIKDANLFDPERGVVEQKGEDVDTEKEINLPSRMPMLDGIFIAGNYKKAVFTYYDKKKKKKVSEYHSEGEKFADALLKKITPEFVMLYYDGKNYKLYPDTKLKAKKGGTSYKSNVPVGPVKTASKRKSVVSSRRTSGSSRNVRKNFYKRNVSDRTNPVRRTPSAGNTGSRTPTRKSSSGKVSNPFSGRTTAPVTKPKSKVNKRTNTPF